MNQSRNNILGKLKAELKGVTPESVKFDAIYYPPLLDESDWLSTFTINLVNNNAIVKHINDADVAETVASFLKEQKISQLMIGDKTWSEKLNTHLQADIEVLPCYKNLSTEKHEVFATVPASMTTSAGAIASTGTIVLKPDENEPRALSLIPPVHIVLVKKSELFADLPSIIKAQSWQTSLPTNLILLSGPSKTADIQQTLAYGAHGPKTLLVLVI